MKYFQFNLLLILATILLLGCQKTHRSVSKIDNKSYINNFELLQENNSNDTRVRITSPKAIIDPINNDIEIFDSSIDILNKNTLEIQVQSGNSTLNNLTNTIKVFKNVNISFLDNMNYLISTNSFNWDLNTSIIDIKNPLTINFNNTEIIASNGLFNIESSILKIDNSIFNRTVYNSEGIEKYQIRINSDITRWFKKKNTLVFTSNDKQVETTIKFLNIK